MMSQLHMLVRRERELSLQAAYERQSVLWREPRSRRSMRVRIPRRRPQPRLAPHQYLELEFIVEERR